MKIDITGRIREKGLKATPARLDVLHALYAEHRAYAHADLENIFGQMDRVTLYRVLNDFEEAGLVHKITDAGGITRFAVCRHDCPEVHHIEEHVHFSCQNCLKMYCMDGVIAPGIKAPKGFKITGTQTLLYGLCKSCNAA